MKLKADPLAVFRESNSPLALHARQRWLGGAGQAASLARQTVQCLEQEQAGDGSWGGSTATTIQRLFALWLLLDQRNRAVERALDWLTEAGYPPMLNPRDDGADYSNLFFRTHGRDRADLRHMRHVPFTAGCAGFVKTGAALFFSMAFGRDGDERVEQAYASVNQTACARQGRLCCGSCASNLHLALAVHPRHNQGAGMDRVLSWLECQMKLTGSWGAGIPFFPTLWMLSQLQSARSDALFHRALARAGRSQHPDGSWGNRQRVLDTFLVLDSLSRKGIEAAVH